MNATIKNRAGEPVVLECCAQAHVDLWTEAARLSGARPCFEVFCDDCESEFRSHHRQTGTCAAAARVVKAVA